MEKERHKLALIWAILVLTSAVGSRHPGLPSSTPVPKFMRAERRPQLSRSRVNWSRKPMSALSLVQEF